MRGRCVDCVEFADALLEMDRGHLGSAIKRLTAVRQVRKCRHTGELVRDLDVDDLSDVPIPAPPGGLLN